MKRVTVSVPEEVDRRAREVAETEDKSLSQVYAEAVEAYLHERQRQQAAERVDALLDRTHVEPEAVDELHGERDKSDRSVSPSRE